MRHIDSIKRRKISAINIWLIIIFTSYFLIACSELKQTIPAPKDSNLKAGLNECVIRSGDINRPYLLYIPVRYDFKIRAPLIILFHGTPSNAKQMIAVSGMDKLSEEIGFVVAAPEGIYEYSWGAGWNTTNNDPEGVNDIVFTKDLIEEISANVYIDSKRIYATGYSAGAMMSSHIACELSDIFAAIAPVAGLKCEIDCAPTRSVPIIAFHGTSDRVLLYQSAEDAASTWAHKNGCGKIPKKIKISDTITQISYDGCTDNAEVVLYRIDKDGHTWPDSPLAEDLEMIGHGKTTKALNASRVMWDFFVSHPLP